MAIYRQDKVIQTINNRTEKHKYFNLYQRVQLCSSDSKQTFIPSHKCKFVQTSPYSTLKSSSSIQH